MKIKSINRFVIAFAVCCFFVGAKAEAQSSAATNYLIVPGGSVGAITPQTGEADLKKIYGAKNVKAARVYQGEGQYEPGTVVFPNDPLKKIEITWKNSRTRRNPKQLRVTGEKSLWKTRDGITLGTRLKELERINSRAFGLSGFAWDYAGTVTSWKNGKLEKAFDNPERSVWLRLSEETGQKISEEEATSVMGDQEFSSSNRVMQKINPKVYQMIVEFP